MGDVFNRSNEIMTSPVNGDGLVGTTALSGDCNRLVIREDGFSKLELSEATKKHNETGGLLIQAFEMNQHDMVPFVKTVLFGPTVVDLSAVAGKVRAALGLAADAPLLIDTVKVEAAPGKEVLTVNGVEVPL
jgi:hypothetical protein